MYYEPSTCTKERPPSVVFFPYALCGTGLEKALQVKYYFSSQLSREDGDGWTYFLSDTPCPRAKQILGYLPTLTKYSFTLTGAGLAFSLLEPTGDHPIYSLIKPPTRRERKDIYF
ncbi:hypothetical protein GGS20DRAFT_297279 [Poronia punctata]|nr:hypothetical protein GGS20DRAFT_297279 [Poronia punctata]